MKKRFTSEDIELLREILEESPQYLEGIEDNILSLEKNPSEEIIDEVFRTFHSLKGITGFVDLPSVTKTCHSLESLVKMIKEDKATITNSIIDLLLDGTDLIKEIMANIESAISNYNGGEIEIDVIGLGEDEIEKRVQDISNLEVESKPEREEIIPEKDISEGILSDTFLTESLNDFTEEFSENISELDELMLNLENHPENKELIADIMRAFHTIKGGARLLISLNPEANILLSLKRIEKISHSLEDVFQSVRESGTDFPTTLVDLIYPGIDMLKALNNSILQNETPVEIENYIEKLEKSLDELASEQKVQKRVEGKREETEIPPSFQAFLNITEQFLDFAEHFNIKEGDIKQLERMATMTISALNAVELKKVDTVQKILKAAEEKNSKVYKDRLKNFSTWFADVVSRYTRITATISPEDETKRIGELLKEDEKISNQILEQALVEQKGTSEKIGKILQKKGITSEEISTALMKQSAARRKAIEKTLPTALTTRTIRVNSEKLDKLMNLAGEVLTLKNQYQHIAKEAELGVQSVTKRLKNSVAEMSRLSNELQAVVMSMRMVPIGTLFNKYKRTVRDLAKSLGKKIELYMEGEETEVDRNVLEKLADPITHMVRNCVDHGIELPTERKAIGKNETGYIRFKAYYRGSYVFVEVEDDGKGIDPNAVRAKAIDKGLVSPEETMRYNDEEILNFIFIPGFSTSEVVSNVSGRGVGMDVVKTNVESMGGKVYVDSKVGKGTKITMRIPLSLSIFKGLMVEIGSQQYILPLDVVEETIKVNMKKIHNYKNFMLVEVRNETIPLFIAEELLNGLHIELKEKSFEFDLVPLVIVSEEGNRFALVVDQFLEESEFLIKSIPDYLRSDSFITGVTILGDGTPVLILNPTKVVR